MTTGAIAEERRDEGRFGAGALERAINYDLSRPLAFAVLALAVVLSRLPFINIGYGTDPDAWRVALSGYWLWDHAEFFPSRLPGYPVPEYASAAVIKGGWLATNSLTLAVSLVGLWFFARIVAKLDLPARGLVVVGFAFTPLIWINSMTTMDYLWAVTFILGCYYLLLTGHVSLAGVMLGLAAASRSTSILFLVPFALFLLREGRRGQLRDFVVWSIAVPVVLYLPIAWRYGPGFLSFYDAKVGYLNVLRLLAKDTLGLIGSATVLAAAIVSLPRLKAFPGDAWRDNNVMVWAFGIGIAVFVFLRLPHEAAYLLPLYPFGFMLMAKYFRRGALIAAIGAILLAGFVDLGTPGDELTLSSLRELTVTQGLVLSNRTTMQAQNSFVEDLDALDFPRHSVVSLGFSYPQFVVKNRDELDVGILEYDESSISQLSDKGKAVDRARDVTYVWLLEYDDFRQYLDQGYTLFYTLDASRSTVALHDFRPGFWNDSAKDNVRFIDLGRSPTGGSGAARTDR